MYFFDIRRQRVLLKKFNFGFPDILKINFVLKSKINNSIKGNEVFKWIIRYSGFSFFNNLKRGKKPNKNIAIKDILLKKKPLSGNFKFVLILKRFIKSRLYSFLLYASHSLNKLIIDGLNFSLEYFFIDITELITAFGVAILDIKGAQ